VTKELVVTHDRAPSAGDHLGADAGSAHPAESARTESVRTESAGPPAAAGRHGRVVAVYPGSFDPATLGHVDIAARAARLVDDLVVAVYATPSKSLLFTTEERVALWRDAIATADLANVRVEPYEGLTTTFARQVGAQAIVRGLRAVSDFEVEFQQALMYRKLAPEIETLMIVSSLRHLFVSSSLLKEVARLGGDVNDLVTPAVARALREKFGL
jgi:pantetheine-phosphate adenylyltransferase